MVFEAYLVPMFGTILGHICYRYIIGRFHWPYSMVAKKLIFCLSANHPH